MTSLKFCDPTYLNLSAPFQLLLPASRVASVALATSFNKGWHSLTLAARQKASLISAAFRPGYRVGDPFHAIGEVRAETRLNLVHICRGIVTREDNTP